MCWGEGRSLVVDDKEVNKLRLEYWIFTKESVAPGSITGVHREKKMMNQFDN